MLKDDLNAFLSIAGDLKIEGLTSTSPPKQAKSGFSSTQEESIAGPQLTSTPIQASTPLPTPIDLNQLSTPSLSTSDLYNPEAGLDLIKKESSLPSEKPCTTPQSRTFDLKSLVKKIRDSEGKRGVECALCGRREGALMEHDMLFTSTARDGKLTTVGYIIVAKKSMAKKLCIKK